MNENQLIPKYMKVYTAMLTQAGTAAPIAIELTNGLGSEVTWTRNSAGLYTITSTEDMIFTDEKTVVLVGETGGYTDGNRVNETSCFIQTMARGTGTPEDDWLEETLVEIRVYS